jgi:hypothetical protein
VLVEQVCRKEKHKVSGRNRQNIKVVFEGGKALIGMIKKVRVASVVGHTLAGTALLAVLAAGLPLMPASAETVDEYFVSGDYENTVREGVKLVQSYKGRTVYYKIGQLMWAAMTSPGRISIYSWIRPQRAGSRRWPNWA